MFHSLFGVSQYNQSTTHIKFLSAAVASSAETKLLVIRKSVSMNGTLESAANLSGSLSRQTTLKGTLSAYASLFALLSKDASLMSDVSGTSAALSSLSPLRSMGASLSADAWAKALVKGKYELWDGRDRARQSWEKPKQLSVFGGLYNSRLLGSTKLQETKELVIVWDDKETERAAWG